MKKITQEDFDELVESLVDEFIDEWSMDEDDYEELLNQIYPDYEMGDFSFSAGRILRELDPIAFRCGLSEEECPEHEIEAFRDQTIEELEEEYEII